MLYCAFNRKQSQGNVLKPQSSDKQQNEVSIIIIIIIIRAFVTRPVSANILNLTTVEHVKLVSN